MTIRAQTYNPNTILYASDIQDTADNGVVEITAVAELDQVSSEVNLVFCKEDYNLYKRIAEGAGAIGVAWESFSGGLAGVGGWATLKAVVNGTRQDYTANGMDWVSYTFTDDGSFTTEEEGLVEMLVVASASMESNNSGAKGGGVLQGVEMVAGGQTLVEIAEKATDINPSLLTQSNGEVIWIGGAGDWSSPPNTGNGGVDLSGNGVFSTIADGTKLGYGGGKAATADYGQGNPPRPNSGGASTTLTTSGSTQGADGVVIIRFPAGNTQGVIESQEAPAITLEVTEDVKKEKKKTTTKR